MVAVSSLVERVAFGDEAKSCERFKVLSENIQDEELALFTEFNGK
jgi:tRNA-(ms[2]io[6]A)-hydroxylase